LVESTPIEIEPNVTELALAKFGRVALALKLA